MPERDIRYSIIYLGDKSHVGFQDLRRDITLEEAVSVGGATDELWGVKSDGKRFSYPIQRFKPTGFAVVEGSYLAGLINCLDENGIIRCVGLELDPPKLESLIDSGTLVISGESKPVLKKLAE